MTDCCNSAQVQSSYSAMSTALKEAILTTSELIYNISQVISDFKEFKVDIE